MTKAKEDYEVLDDTERVSLRKIGEERVRQRISEYEAEFEADSLTTVDRAQIRRMAKLEFSSYSSSGFIVPPMRLFYHATPWTQWDISATHWQNLAKQR